MRLNTLLLPLVLGCTTVFASDVTFVRVLPAYMPASEFKRISEYFTGQENTRGAIVLRTQPTSRDGFYFTLRVESAAPIEAALLELQFISPTSPEAQTKSFAVTLPQGSQLIRFGLTGKDWPNPKDHPVAWKMRLLGLDGAELATEQSYLWSKPDTPSDPK